MIQHGRLSRMLSSQAPSYTLMARNPALRYLASRPDPNNGTVAGGLASALQSAMVGRMLGERERAAEKFQADQSEALQAMVQGYGAKPWQVPEGETVYAGPSGSGAGPVSAPVPEPSGGIAGALAAVSNLKGNEFAGPLSQRLMLARMEADAARDAAPKFETVESPFGRGGVGQRNTASGQIVNYHGPEREDKPGGMWAYDREAGTTRFVSEDEVSANPHKYARPADAPDTGYKSRRRPVDDSTELFEVSQDGGKTWAAVGQPYARGGNPMDAMIAALFGGPDGLIDEAPKTAEASGDLYSQALEASRAGADPARIRERLEQNGGSWNEFLRRQAAGK